MTATSTAASPSLTHRRFLSLAIPNILTNLTVPLAGLLDMAFLGHQDTVLPLAGVALGAIIFNYLYWSFGFLRMGTTGLVANAYGADDREAQAAIFWRAMALAVLIGGLILLFQIPIGHLAFTLLDGDAGVEVAGKDYYHARVWSAIAVMGVYVCNGWLLGRQHPKVVLAISSLLNGLNILLDWWFIVILDWGAAGAGYATAIAEWTAFIAGLLWISNIRKRGLPRIPWQQILHWQAFGDMLRLSRDLMLRTFCLITTFAIFTVSCSPVSILRTTMVSSSTSRCPKIKVYCTLNLSARASWVRNESLPKDSAIGILARRSSSSNFMLFFFGKSPS